MTTKIPKNGYVIAYCRSCNDLQVVRLWTLISNNGAPCSKCGERLERTRNGMPTRKLLLGVTDSIGYPKRYSEFEIQAYIYHTLKAKGFDVRGEVTSRRGTAKLDLVVYNEHKLVACIIEVKAAAPNLNSSRTTKLVDDDTQEQVDYYRTLCPRVELVCGMMWAVKFCESFTLAAET
jgi:hypothetical protein